MAQFDEALAVFEKARTEGSINVQMRYWESEVHLLHGDLAKVIAVSEEALALDPEASVFVDRVQKLKALERPSEPPPPAAPSLGARLRARLQVVQTRRVEGIASRPPRGLSPTSPRRGETPSVASRPSRSPPQHRGAVQIGPSPAANGRNSDQAALQFPLEAPAQVEIAMTARPREVDGHHARAAGLQVERQLEAEEARWQRNVWPKKNPAPVVGYPRDTQ